MHDTSPRLAGLNLPKHIQDLVGSLTDISEAERQGVRTAIAGLQSRALAIDKQVRSLSLPRDWFIRKDLRREKELLDHQTNAYRSLLAPWRRLPLELWVEVFTHCFTPGGKESTGPPDPRKKHPASPTCRPEVLSLVSRPWRAILLSIAPPWLDVTLSTAREKQPEGLWKPVVKTKHVPDIITRMGRIARHRPTPWSLTIVESSYQGSPRRKLDLLIVQAEETDDLSSLLNKAPESTLQRLHLKAYVSAPYICRFPHLPSVKSLVLECERYGSNEEGIKFPNLTHVVARLPSIDSDIPSHVQWSTLTHLFLGGDMHPELTPSVLARCPFLQEACFEYCESERWMWRDIDAIEPTTQSTLASLHTLSFLGVNPFASVDFVNISLPALTKIRVMVGCHPWEWLSENLRFLSTVTHLDIDGSVDPYKSYPSALPLILDASPNLIELQVHFISDLENLSSFQALVYDPQKPRLQCLKALTIHCNAMEFDGGLLNLLGIPSPFNADTFPCSAVAGVVASRSTGEAKLDRFTFRLDGITARDFRDPILEKLSGVLQAFTDLLDLTVEGVYFGLNFRPRLTWEGLTHWDDGLMDRVEAHWHFDPDSQKDKEVWRAI